MALNLLRFFEEEVVVNVHADLAQKKQSTNEGKNWNKEKLADLSQVMSQASICGLGQTNKSTKFVLKYFENEIMSEDKIKFYLNDKKVEANQGETIAANSLELKFHLC